MTTHSDGSSAMLLLLQQRQQQQRRQKRCHRRRRHSTLILFVFSAVLAMLCPQCAESADLVINVPNASSNENAFYRIDYSPAVGYPEPNTTIAASEIGKDIKFSRAQPGAEYNFWIYYTNSTHQELLTWTVNITTAPDPPANLSVQLRSSKSVLISWKPPAYGKYSAFKIRVLGLTEPPHSEYNRSYVVGGNETLQLSAKELTPGGSYQVQAYTVYRDKESVAYTSRNFTTKPNTPGKFIVWFRNETTLLVLWQPPYPAGIYTHYKVSITPDDALESVLYVEREGEPPGPAQAAFKGLVPGRAYNISVQTVSEEETSVPTTARYLTVPERPLNVTFDEEYTSSSSFRVRWEAPKTYSEYDSFQVSLSTSRRIYHVPRSSLQSIYFDYPDALEAGKTYSVVVKTISDSVNSWPATGEITLRPRSVHGLRGFLDDHSNVVHLSWEPDAASKQDSYRISFYEKFNETFSQAPIYISTLKTEHKLEHLLPGRRYRIGVQAVSNAVASNFTYISKDTRPSAPVIQELHSIQNGLNISWMSEPNSQQDKYEVHYHRNGTNEERTISTTKTNATIKYLHAGSSYEIKVYALSHDLRSEPHAYYQAVFPKPPRNLTQRTVHTNLVLLNWLPPEGSDYNEFVVRYRTNKSPWQRLSNVRENQARIENMHYGERYVVQVNTLSFGVESLTPLELNVTMPPQPVSNVVPLVDSRNLTLEWPKPDGHVDYYTIKWWASTDPQQIDYKNVTYMPEENTGNNVRILIDGLSPGRQYKFEVQASSNGIRSGITHLSTRTMPIIQSDVLISNQEQEEQHNVITLSYTPTPTSTTSFDIYRFSLGDPEIKDKEKLANDTDRKVIFTELTPGRLYNITVWTVSGGVASLPIQRLYRLYPVPIERLEALSVEARSIVLHWKAPPGEFSDFELQFLNAEEQLIQTYTKHTQLKVEQLQPYHNYTFTVTVRSGSATSMLRNSASVSASYQTLQALPGRVDYFQPYDVQPSEITFEWKLSRREQNGPIQYFNMSYQNLYDDTDMGSFQINANKTHGRIGNLLPGNTYIFRIQAKSTLGFGAEREHRQLMPIQAPPAPAPHIMPIEVSHSASTITMRFRKDYFSNAHGLVRLYTIIVAEDVSKNASGLEMPSWQDVQAYTVWLPYQAVEPFNPFANGSVEDFLIGSGDCAKHQAGYCNGPLRSGTTYRIKVRAFTDDDKFTDTAYSEPITTERSDAVWLASLVSVLLCLLCIVLVGIYTHYRCKSVRCSEKIYRINEDLILADTYSRPIHVKDFAEHFRIMSADSDFRFSEEFEELKNVGRDQPCTFADLPCNRPKNRFSNILPYDHSRFKLQPVDDDEGSDYINANYMPGYNSPREFIVTQGPLSSTRVEFWRMCWESNSRAIIMLTRCFEKAREKCDQYWPVDRVPMFYGDIKVQLITDTHCLDWTISEFMVSRNCESRIMRHFHFTRWPDFGVPSPPQSLVRFVRAFRDVIGTDMRPIIVHCSAGVGRSGTFIALDRILQQIDKSDYVDIFGIVFAMRKERSCMVQTEQQYVCIHQCLLTVLEGKEHLLQDSQDELHENDGYEVTKIYLERKKIISNGQLMATPASKINAVIPEEQETEDTQNDDDVIAAAAAAAAAAAEDDDEVQADENVISIADAETDEDGDVEGDDQQPLTNETTITLSSSKSSSHTDVQYPKQQQQQGTFDESISNSTDIDTDTEDEDGDGIDKSPLLDDEGIAETGI